MAPSPPRAMVHFKIRSGPGQARLDSESYRSLFRSSILAPTMATIAMLYHGQYGSWNGVQGLTAETDTNRNASRTG